MTGDKIKNNKLQKTILGLLVLLTVVFFSAKVMATNSDVLFIKGTLAECKYPQKTNGGPCLERLNAKSCVNTSPFSPMSRGVSSEMCARGREWCSRNDPPPAKHKRCKNVYAGNGAKNHEGYDYTAPCGTRIFAPCEGDSVFNGSSSVKPIKFTCTICGKKYEFSFLHTQGTVGNGHYKKGDLIGFSGNATGYPCHMHIEIRQGGLLMDPMNPGFDNEVCSCTNNEKVNRLECFKNGSAASQDTSTPNTGYQTGGPVDAVYTAEANSASSAAAGEEPAENCVYANVQAEYTNKGCFFCVPFRIIFNTASVMAKASFDNLSKWVYIVVMVAFAIWLCVTIMQFVAHFEIRDPRNLVKVLLHQAFKVLFVVILLYGPEGKNLLSEILDMTVTPVFSTGMKIAQMGGNIASGESPSDCGLVSPDSPAAGSGESTTAAGSSTTATGSLPTAGGDSDNSGGGDTSQTVGVTTSGGLSAEIGNGALCTIKTIQDKIMDIMAISRVSWCLSWEHCPIGKLVGTCLFFPHIGYAITAAAFFAASFLLLVMYPWLLVDSILKLCAVISLLPAAVGAWAFKSTSQYIKRIWAVFLDAVFTFIFLSITVMIIASIAKKDIAELIDPYTERGVFLANMMWWGVEACKVSFVCLLGWALLHEIKDYAKNFTQSISGYGSQTSDIGPKVGTVAGGVAKALAKDASEPVKGGIGWAANTTGENLSHFKRWAHKNLQERYGDSGDNDADDEDGSSIIGSAGGGGKTGTSASSRRSSKKGIGRKLYSMLHNTKQGMAKMNNKVMDAFHINENSWLGGKSWIGQDWNALNTAMHMNPGENKFEQDETGNILQTNTVTYADGSQLITKTDDYASVKIRRTADGKETIQEVKLRNATKKIANSRGKIDANKLRTLQQSTMWSDEEKSMIIMKSIVERRMGSYTGGTLDSGVNSRSVKQSVTDDGVLVINIEQVNADKSTTTFSASIQGSLAMNEIKTVYTNGESLSYKTDGIIQCISEFANGEVNKNYSIHNDYASSVDHPIHTDGTVSEALRAEVLFSKEELEEFGRQIRREGNESAHQSFTSFKN